MDEEVNDSDTEVRLDAGAIEDSDDEEYGQKSHTGPSAQKRARRAKANEITPEDEMRESKLHANDPGNFLKLCIALQILVSRTITEEDLIRADSLLRSYCMELVQVCPFCPILKSCSY